MYNYNPYVGNDQRLERIMSEKYKLLYKSYGMGALHNPKNMVEKKTKYISKPEVISKIHISKLVMFRWKYPYIYIYIVCIHIYYLYAQTRTYRYNYTDFCLPKRKPKTN